MRIQTFSVVAGSEACNARCPFCISKMTVPHGIELHEPEVNWRNFRKACQLARSCGVTTAMITGKGEPTLFPNQITRYLHEMRDHGFPLVELQTNGIPIMERRDAYTGHLKEWHHLGLTLLAISIVHFEPDRNREVYLPHKPSYIDLPALVDLLHARGFSVRLACVLAGGYIDGEAPLRGLLQFARDHKVEQLTIRPVNRPAESRDPDASSWSMAHALGEAQMQEIKGFLAREGRLLMSLQHGATVYDVGGQNLCLTDSLTLEPGGEDLRQLIFFPDGHLRYDWQYAGAILL